MPSQTKSLRELPPSLLSAEYYLDQLKLALPEERSRELLELARQSLVAAGDEIAAAVAVAADAPERYAQAICRLVDSYKDQGL